MVMMRQRIGNVVKGIAWLSLAAAALPTLTTSEGPSGSATRLSVGLPWSPWLVYRESWIQPATADAETPVLSCETTIEPRSDSTVALVTGGALLLIARLIKSSRRRGSRFDIRSSAFTRPASGLRR